jgi:hypothetical protein
MFAYAAVRCSIQYPVAFTTNDEVFGCLVVRVFDSDKVNV